MFRSLLVVFILLSISDAHRNQVVVVGAGVSGFTAAATLLQHNVTDLLVLEASDRLGGRIHTVEFGGVLVEEGADFIHGKVDNIVYEMVRPFKKRFLASYGAYLKANKMLFTNTSGHIFNSVQVTELLDQVYSILENQDLKNFKGSLADFFYPRFDQLMRSHKVDPVMAEAICHLGAVGESLYIGADDLSQPGTWGYSHYRENKGDPLIQWRTGGFKTIFDILSKKFPNPKAELPVLKKTLFNKQVTKITRRKGEVEVECADGSSYLTDHVIVTLSLGVLKKHAASMFHPALSPVKTSAIETMGFGCVGKVFLLFPTRWWPNSINAMLPLLSEQELEEFRTKSVHVSWAANMTGFYPVMNHDRMLCVWFSGDSCRTMEARSEQEVADDLLKLLDKLVGKKFQIQRPERIFRSSWYNNPYTLGSHSFHTVASDKLNITSDILAEPIMDDKGKPVIMFAGEATHPNYPSTVHGALASGQREAENLVSFLKQ